MRSTILFTIVLFSVSACSVTQPKMNEPLKALPKVTLPSNSRSDELSLILTFSGGGTRAAALSYGVLQELRDTPVVLNKSRRRLLDEVDLISSVSGGSFTSAYYGLFGERIFTDFDKKFLKKRVQSELVRYSFLSPRAWIRLAPAIFERSDLAAEYYSWTIFDRKNFADMRKDGPLIVINATDLSLGRGFSFSDYHFNWICSDLDSYPVGRAVAASSAVPVVFSPITLKNHSGNCSVDTAQLPGRKTSRQSETRLQQALTIQNYRDSNKYRYLHLVDGGVSDNLGVRSILDIVTINNDDMWKVLKSYGMAKTKRVAYIVVNAASSLNPSIAVNRVVPNSAKVIDATTTIQSDQYNVETLELLRSKFPKWKAQVKAGRCREMPSADCGEIDFSLIRVSLKDLRPEERKELAYIPTALELPASSVDRLKSVGRRLLRRSAEYQRLIDSLK